MDKQLNLKDVQKEIGLITNALKAGSGRSGDFPAKSEKAEKQGVIRPLKEREEEQKTLVCEGFLNERFEGEDIPSELRQLVYEFWDALMAKNRLYIFK